MNVSDHTASKKSYLHNLYGHSKGIQLFIFNLKESRLSDFFNSSVTIPRSFGPKNHNGSVPWYTEWTWCLSNVSFLRRLQEPVRAKMFLLEFLETNLGRFQTFPLLKLGIFCNVLEQSCPYLAVLEMLTFYLDIWSLELFHVQNLCYF